jgi:hypothetical protein
MGSWFLVKLKIYLIMFYRLLLFKLIVDFFSDEEIVVKFH